MYHYTREVRGSHVDGFEDHSTPGW